MKSLKYDGIGWSHRVHDIRAQHYEWPTGLLHGFLRLKMGTNGILFISDVKRIRTSRTTAAPFRHAGASMLKTQPLTDS